MSKESQSYQTDIFQDQLLHILIQDSQVEDECFVEHWADQIWLSLKTCWFPTDQWQEEQKLEEFTLAYIQQMIRDICDVKDELESVNNYLLCQSYVSAIEKMRKLSYRDSPMSTLQFEDVTYFLMVAFELELVNLSELGGGIEKWVQQIIQQTYLYKSPSQMFLILFYLSYLPLLAHKKDQRLARKLFAQQFAQYLVEDNQVDVVLMSSIQHDMVLILKSQGIYDQLVKECINMLNSQRSYKYSLNLC